MTHPCPDCGTPFELEDRTIPVRQGTCPGCHRTFTLLPHHIASEAAPAPDGIAPASPEGAAEGAIGPDGGDDLDEEDDEDEATPPASESDADTPVCGNCGSDLVFRATDDVTIEVFCPKCNETTRFRAEGAEAPARPERERAPRREWGDRPPREGGERRRFEDAPRGRGCRKCGGPIDFQTTEDGGKEGVCRNCGNRFRLAPRAEGDSDRGYRGGGYRSGGYRGGGSRGPPRGRPGGYRSRGPPRGDRPRRRRDDE